MGVYDDCRHYVKRSTAGGDAIEQCKLGANVTDPAFACPEGCLFHEPRTITDVGWQRTDPDPDR
ncbi:MAG: hypothetical protein NVSMB4_21460 [Acidimicrobiales bacterium]